jgi:hypothetical protein
MHLWPYVNGKGIAHGLCLAEMDASDMLDVIHYFFEDDYRYSTNEESIYKDEFRKSFYSRVYNYTYKYASEDRESSQSYRDFDAELGNSTDEPEEIIQPFSPREQKATKAFIEATPMVGDEVRPFGSILDSPIG